MKEPPARPADQAVIVQFPISSAPLLRALEKRNYLEPTPVQAAVLDAGATGRDLLVSAQTGSGKTVAFGLAMARDLLGDAEAFEPASHPLALVVAPTRELALQVQRELTWLYGFTGGRVVACVGGMDPRREQRLLAQGTHIVVGTPGRLRDHLERHHLDLTNLRALVLDEADEMLDLGFREDLEFILSVARPERRTLLFSATLPKPIVALARTYQRDALRLEVKSAERGHADIEYRAIRVLPREIPLVVMNLLRFFEAPAALVFCNTREAVRHHHALLLERGFSVVALSGELSQNERNHALQALRDGRARVCVATDVAARGIDLPGLDLVIHADFPHDAEALQHRSGRTGRAGRKGVSVLLVPASRRRKAEMLFSTVQVAPVWAGPPTADDIRRLDQERLVRNSIFDDGQDEDDIALGSALLAEHSPERIAAALVQLYRQRLPAPEDVSDPGFRPAHAERPRREAMATAESSTRSFAQGAWFVLTVGRSKGADPKWLLPMLCRRGGITRDDLGPIRIFERETKVLISDQAARDFARAVHDTEVQGIRIQPVADAARAPKHLPRRAMKSDRPGNPQRRKR